MSLPVHRSHERSAADRGFAFGRAHAERVENTVGAYRRLFRAACDLGAGDVRSAGAQVRETLGRWPDLVEEIAALADGAGQDELELMAINARTELLAGARRPECTFVGGLPRATAGGRVLMAQNWDWHPDLARSLVLWTVSEPSGGWFTTLTEAGILAKIGLNSRRLGCLNLLGSVDDGGSTACRCTSCCGCCFSAATR